MALNFGKGNRSIAFAPTAAFPLNANSYFESYDLALAAALTAKPAGDTSTKYYFGQEIAVVEMVNNVPQSAKLYLIVPKEVDGVIVGDLQEVGSSAENEIVQDQIAEVQGDIAQAQEDIDAVEESLAKAEEDIIAAGEKISTVEEGLGQVEENLTAAEEKIETINGILYGVEGEEAVEGLVDKVAGIEGEIDGIQEAIADVYTKEEVDGLVSGVFHFKGEVESMDSLPAASAENIGHVYQIGDLEYASNGEEWVELGFVVDLSSYATKGYVDDEVKKVQDALDIAEGVIEGHTSDIEEINGAIETINGEIESLKAADEGFVAQFETVNGKIEALEAADEAFTAQFETVSGKIEALEAADEAFDSRIGTLETNVGVLEGYIGTPVGDLGALYPAVENLTKRINDIVAEGGEPNQLNGITVNGAALTPNEALIIDLPVFDGTSYGLVPVVGEDVVVATSFLSAEGNWVDVAALINDKLDEALTWEKIE